MLLDIRDGICLHEATERVPNETNTCYLICMMLINVQKPFVYVRRFSIVDHLVSTPRDERIGVALRLRFFVG